MDEEVKKGLSQEVSLSPNDTKEQLGGMRRGRLKQGRPGGRPGVCQAPRAACALQGGAEQRLLQLEQSKQGTLWKVVVSEKQAEGSV